MKRTLRFPSHGIAFAIATPFVALLGATCVDADAVRVMVMSASTSEFRFFVVTTMMAGLLLAAFLDIHPQRYAEDTAYATQRADPREDSDPARDWWINLKHDGSQGAVREMQLDLEAPNVPQRWEIVEFSRELRSIDAGGSGSDLLDRRLAKVLKCDLNGTRPTQSVEDATRLLKQRFGGQKSNCEWEVRTSPMGAGGYRAWVAIKWPGTGTREQPWQQSHIGLGSTEALAIVRAVLDRESWTWLR